MPSINSTPPLQRRSTSPLADELRDVFGVIDDAPIVQTLSAYRWTGRKGWDLQALWRSFVAASFMNVGTTNDVIRHLQNNRDLRDVCGFGDELPSRWTFNRFHARLAKHESLVQECLASLTRRLRDLLPGFGTQVAIDATVVRTHCNPDKPKLSDPEASWTVKNGTIGRKQWYWGYKLHLAVDATYELPIAYTVTTAKRQDGQQLPPVIESACKLYDWFRPRTVSADAGYDFDNNYAVVKAIGASPVIKAKKLRKHFEVDDPALPRSSVEWQRVYDIRQSVERAFSRLKGHRALNSHCRRGLERVHLHSALALVALQATAVSAASVGNQVAACTRRVA